MQNTSDSITFIGGAVKALENGKVGGYLLRYGNETDTDLEGEYFTKSTDFGTLKTTDVLYHHGMDKTLKMAIIGTGDLKADETGLWIESQLELRNQYERAIYEMAKAGKLSWSSGVPSHLTSRESTGKSTHITTWRIAEASLTPTPAEPRNIAVPIKSLSAPPSLVVINVSDDHGGTDSGVIQNATDADQETVKTTTQEAPIMEEKNEVEAVEPATEVKNVSLTLTPDEIQARIDSAVATATKTVTAKFSAPSIVSAQNLGSSETKSFAAFVRGADGERATFDVKASNATDMNIGTAADGGNAVPTGHFNQIVARRDEAMLNLGFTNIPGRGTTVNVPIDNEADGEFVATSEAATFDLDAPAIGQVAMTLVKYTKRIVLSDELLEDEDSQLMAFISNFVGRGMAKTHNNLIVTEALAGGTNLVTLAGASAITAGEVKDIKYGLASEYRNGAQWITTNATEGAIRKLQGSDFLFDTTARGIGGDSLLMHPINNSQYVPAMTTGNKSVIFGNFQFMGVRNGTSFNVLRDPYSLAASGQVVLHYQFRTVYKTLQAEAIGYATQA